MSTDRWLFLSAYMLIDFKKIEVPYKSSGCNIHGYHDFPYCRTCGSQAEIKSGTELKYPFMYEILEELDIDEDMFVIQNNEEDKSKQILLPNNGEGDIEEYENIELEISPDLPEKAIKEFMETYEDNLLKIRSSTKYIESCAVKFGIVQYFS